MNIEKILSLVGADKLAPEIKGQITELLELLIADPKYTPALEKAIILIGADRLDAPTQETIKENLMSVIDVAAKHLLKEVGSAKVSEIRQIRRKSFEKKVISRLYCSDKNENEKVLSENGDPEIAKLAKQNASRASTISKTNFQWDTGFMSDPMKETQDKISKKDHKWDKDTAYTPLSGKVYKTGAGGR